MTTRLTPTHRRAAILGHLTRDLEVRDRTEPDWLAAHPAGFGSVCTVDEYPLYYSLSTARLSELTAHLDDDRLHDVLDSIHAWWNYSTTYRLMRYPVDLIGHEFMSAHATAAAALVELASSRRIPRESLFVP